MRSINMSAPFSLNMKQFCVNCQRTAQQFQRCFSVGFGHNAVLKGWVRHIRKQKFIAFIHLNDGSQKPAPQIVAAPELCSSEVTEGSCISVFGKFQKSLGKEQDVEFVAEEIKVHGACDVKTFPFQPRKIHSHEHLRQFLHLRSKTALISAVMRIRNTATMAVHKFFQEYRKIIQVMWSMSLSDKEEMSKDNGYICIHTPILSSNDCEGAGQLFNVKVSEKTDDDVKESEDEFFKKPVYLTVSGQLHLEAMSSGISKVYTFSPAFRAEKSSTSHHLAEFYMIEAELAFAEHLEDIMQVMEGLIKSITKETLETSAEDIQFVHKRNSVTPDLLKAIEDIIKKEFIRVSYEEAIDIVNKHCENTKLKWGDDLQKADEKFLVKYCGNVPVFVTNYPEELKPFYARQNSDQRTVAGLDLLIPRVGELCGGTLREERYNLLHQKLKSKNLLNPLSWYLDIRKYGTSPHGGFGMGFDRYLQFLLGMPNIKDVTAFPRWTRHCPL